MPVATTSRGDIARRGQEYYDEFLRAGLVPKHNGEFLVLDVETGQYEMDRSELAAIRRAKTRVPEGVFYILRVGYPTSVRIGAQLARSGA